MRGIPRTVGFTLSATFADCTRRSPV